MSYTKRKFIRIYETEVGHSSAKEAYEKVERLHVEKFGKRRYKNYNTYKVTLCRHRKVFK